ncbi:MAG: hypothetical protein NT129_00815 [Candidatus Aenigmarchaeota archaeon]|nr:hypothetical protein [Candidatus Aenigmarchaeota archaeon]
MWKDEDCLIISFMENSVNKPSEIPLSFETEEREMEIPTEIKLATPEELAVKMIDFARREFPDKERIYINNISQLFWGQKNIDRYGAPPDIQLKIQKAEFLAQKKLDEEREIERNETLEKEKNEMPSLVSSCVDWAKGNGLKRITQSDVVAFLLENGIRILPQTQRAVYAMANVAIKKT